MTDPVTSYAAAVVAGEIVAGPHVRAACRRHLSDLERDDISFNLAAAAHALDFFPGVLRLSEGQFEGRPFELHPSQAFIIGSIFGWHLPDGTRRFQRCYIEQGKGNGKSPLAGGIGLYGLCADGEAGAQIYAVAAKREQAMILFTDAAKMVEQSPSLKKRITPSGRNPVWNLAHLRSGSFFRPISREGGKSGSGPRPHFALADELHEHPDRGSVEMLERGFKFRENPLLLMITNSGSNRNSYCWEEHEHAVNVAHGDAIDDRTFSYVCALDEGDDPLEDPSCWVKANPLLGVTITKKYLSDVVAQAKAIPGKLNGILRLHFCMWTDAETAWISRASWEACEDPDFWAKDYEGRECFVGLDLSSTLDMTGLAIAFPDGEDEDGRPRYALFARAYTPKDTIAERALKDRAPYEVWEREGFLIGTPGPKVRFDFVAEDLARYAERFSIKAVAYDQWLIKTFKDVLEENGIDLPLIEHPQGWTQRKDSPLWMPGSVDFFETLILEGRLRVEVNSVLRSAVAGATFATSAAGLRRFEKSKASTRIDAVIAATMALGAAQHGEAGPSAPGSPWSDPDFSLANLIED